MLAANTVLRSLFGAAFPLFTTQMYDNLGIHWASCIPAFLALACCPFPFLFYKYGPAIRQRCKFAKQAEQFMRNTQKGEKENDESNDDTNGSESGTSNDNNNADAEKEKEHERDVEREEREQQAIDYSYESAEEQPRFERIKTANETAATDGTMRPMGSRKASMSSLSRTNTYEHSPFDIDHMSTREHFAGGGQGLWITRSRTSNKAPSVKSRR